MDTRFICIIRVYIKQDGDVTASTKDAERTSSLLTMKFSNTLATITIRRFSVNLLETGLPNLVIHPNDRPLRRNRNTRDSPWFFMTEKDTQLLVQTIEDI
ncbi:unnamed protein product [Leptosia nina]|uniref:Uncharacterized protein n=1 Tax=Leptosia nina TaxID=320188 RepID=A0AAV1J5H1_9NEOP